ncbi:ABC transporter ATP-binding protein, partial [Mycobacterium tuberculosis]|nr:ABC transporter ATP-binding protein [Mycobacterium tuberculosis]
RRSGSGAAADSAARLRRGDLLVRIGSNIDDLGAVIVRALVPIAVAAVLAAGSAGGVHASPSIPRAPLGPLAGAVASSTVM